MICPECGKYNIYAQEYCTECGAELKNYRCSK